MRTTAQAGTWTQNPLRQGAPGVSEEAATPRFQLYEYAYYLILCYSLLNSTLGITIPYLGTLSLLALAALCVLRLKSTALATYKPLLRPFLCIAAFSFVQIYVHDQRITDLILMITWSATLIVIQTLNTRPGFLRRFIWVLFSIGLMLLPFLSIRGNSDRMGLDASSSLANPNSLAAWFGFCAVAFMIRALESRRFLVRVVCGGIAFFSILIVGLTVSRGALVAISIATVIVFRKQLRRGFVPLLILVVVVGALFALGLFDTAIAHYEERGTQETGRMTVLPYVVHRIIKAPVAGVGLSQVPTVAEGRPHPTNPHNTLLFFPLAAGFVPLVFFLAYWVSGFRGALRSTPQNPYHNYLMPLFVYSSFHLLVADADFTAPWFIAIFAPCLAVWSSPRPRRTRAIPRRVVRNQQSRVFGPRRP